MRPGVGDPVTSGTGSTTGPSPVPKKETYSPGWTGREAGNGPSGPGAGIESVLAITAAAWPVPSPFMANNPGADFAIWTATGGAAMPLRVKTRVACVSPAASQGICTFACVGDTHRNGSAMPLTVTLAPNNQLAELYCGSLPVS